MERIKCLYNHVREIINLDISGGEAAIAIHTLKEIWPGQTEQREKQLGRGEP